MSHIPDRHLLALCGHRTTSCASLGRSPTASEKSNWYPRAPGCQASNGVGAAAAHVPLDIEDGLPQAPMRVHSEEALAQDEEADQVKYTVRRQVVELDPVRV